MDARLQSVHLHYPRRQEFRLAREQLLRMQGRETALHQGETPLAPVEGGAPASSEANTLSVGLPFRFALLDGDVVHPLKYGLNTIGRSSQNDVILNENYVSRRHCAIVVHASSGCEIFDLASRNGTYLNDCSLQRARILRNGDFIRICDRKLVFVEHCEPASLNDQDTQHIS